MSTAKEHGKRGEDAVCAYLLQAGFTVLARNYTVRGGELDLVAAKDGVLAFIEVKTRMRARECSRYGRPAAAMTLTKWTHFRFAAECYLREHPHTGTPRFDVAEVYLEPDGRTEIKYYASVSPKTGW